MANFRKFELTENMRAKEDPWFADLIGKLHTTDPACFPFYEYLQKTGDLDKFILKDGDIALDEKLRTASILTGGNHLRFETMRRVGPALAQYLNQYLIRWKLDFKMASGESALSEEEIDDLYRLNPQMWGYFIRGAAGYITETISHEWLLSRNCSITMFDLKLSDDPDHDYNCTIDTAAMASARAGDTVTLERPPNVLYVRVKEPGPTPDFYDSVSVTSGDRVIPVDMLTRSNVFRAPEQKLYVSRGTVMVKLTSHHVELALAATFHKAQGTFVKFVLNRLSCSLIPYRTNDGTQVPRLRWVVFLVTAEPRPCAIHSC